MRMNRDLTGMNKTKIMFLVGETEAGSAEVQPARDSRARATDGRRGDGLMLSSHFFEYYSEPSYALKNLLAEGKAEVNRKRRLSISR